MTDTSLKLPFYAKATIILIGLIAFIWILYIAGNIILPFIFSVIIAILLNPIVNFFVRKKVNRIFAIGIALFLTFIVIAGFCTLIFSQTSHLTESLPVLIDKISEMLSQITTWTSDYFHIKPNSIHDWIADRKSELLFNSGSAIGKTLIFLGEGILIAILLPVYIFLILFYKPLLLESIHRIFGTINDKKVSEIIKQINKVIQQYLIGLLIELFIVAALEIIALWILGIEYAILLGIIGALLNLIPYIGGVIAVALPMMIALVTKSTPMFALYIMIIYYIIQLIDNNYIVPKIVASKVKINALFSILAILIGNAVWGIPGMFLSIPLLAIIKLIFDHIDSLKPYGFLLGDTMPSIIHYKSFNINKIKIRHV